MQTIISTIEEAIYQKKQNLRYQHEEMERMQQRIYKDQTDVLMLEMELNELKNPPKEVLTKEGPTNVYKP